MKRVLVLGFVAVCVCASSAFADGPFCTPLVARMTFKTDSGCVYCDGQKFLPVACAEDVVENPASSAPKLRTAPDGALQYFDPANQIWRSIALLSDFRKE